jgi:glycosyl-4,4'-diaponeurosporenoate acyltransferase
VVIDLPVGLAVVVDVAASAVIGVVVGYALHRTASSRLDHDTWLTRIRGAERGGRAYERWGIRRWKDRLPEAGALFAGGVSKRTSGGRDQLDRFATETRRAEWTHWILLACSPLFALWNPWYLTIAMVAYAVAANVPCLVVQRYNRARIERALALDRARSARRGRRVPPSTATDPPGSGAPRPTAT